MSQSTRNPIRRAVPATASRSGSAMPHDNNSPAATEVDVPPRRPARPADPCAMVIFGAAGDLTKRLVVPALYNLARTKVLPENFALIGVDHGERTTESWRTG